MRRIILDIAVTLDGFIEGANGEVDWCIMDDDMGFDEFLSSIDTIFYGRVSYDMWGNFHPIPTASAAEKNLWEAVHSKQKYVFSRQPRHDDKATVITSNLVQSVNEIKNSEGKDIWLYGGASLITTFLSLGLIDVYRLAVHPTVLGEGKPLFANVQDRLNLQLLETKQFASGVVQLIYKPKG